MAHGPTLDAGLTWIFPERVTEEVLEWLIRCVSEGADEWILVPHANRPKRSLTRQASPVGKIVVTPA